MPCRSAGRKRLARTLTECGAIFCATATCRAVFKCASAAVSRSHAPLRRKHVDLRVAGNRGTQSVGGMAECHLGAPSPSAAKPTQRYFVMTVACSRVLSRCWLMRRSSVRLEDAIPLVTSWVTWSGSLPKLPNRGAGGGGGGVVSSS